jgi:hypothetical protein
VLTESWRDVQTVEGKTQAWDCQDFDIATSNHSSKTHIASSRPQVSPLLQNEAFTVSALLPMAMKPYKFPPPTIYLPLQQHPTGGPAPLPHRLRPQEDGRSRVKRKGRPMGAKVRIFSRRHLISHTDCPTVRCGDTPAHSHDGTASRAPSLASA